MFNRLKLLAPIFFTLLISACASPPKPIPYIDHIDAGKKVGIALIEVPSAAVRYEGSIGLLDLAVISAANSNLNSYLKTLNFEEYEQVGIDLKAVLSESGVSAHVYSELIEKPKPPFKAHKNGNSRNNYAYILGEENLDYLLVLQVTGLGAKRTYYGPIPTAAPLAYANIWGELVDLKTKDVLWYKKTQAVNAIPEPWSESSKNHPNLTSAIYQSLNEAMSAVVSTLSHTESNFVTKK